MKRKFNLDKLKKLHSLSDRELQCIKGGKKGNNNKGHGIPPRDI